MVVICEDIIINMDNIIDTFVADDVLVFEADNTMTYVKGHPNDALQKIAVAMAEKQPYIELEGKMYEPDPSTGSSGDTSDDSEFSID